MVYLWVKDKDNANDILQNVFEKAWLKRDEIDKIDNPIGWMVKSLKNESLMFLRVASKRVPFDNFEIEDLIEDSDHQRPNRNCKRFQRQFHHCRAQWRLRP